jgi:TatD DNase family protein
VVDTHAHLSSEAFAADRDAILAAASSAGVTWVLNVADDLQTARHAAAWTTTSSGVYAAVGIHPHAAIEWSPQAEMELHGLLDQPKVVAVGEIGLDYHYDYCPRDQQRTAFTGQLRLAQEMNMPVVIHNRNADIDTLTDLSKYKGLRGVMHCFWSTWETATVALEMGLYIGVGGPLTFTNTGALREVIRQVPLERIVLETDSPYLAPKPYRGKRNEPAFVTRVAVYLAELLGVTPELVAEVTTRNAENLFLK